MNSSAHAVAPPNRGTNDHTEWDENVACSSPHAAPIRLSDKELEPKRRELQQLARTSFAWRAFTYFMGCFACQAFWTAVAIYALTRGITDPAGWFFSAAAYSGAAVLLSVLYGTAHVDVPDAASRRAGCKNCGKWRAAPPLASAAGEYLCLGVIARALVSIFPGLTGLGSIAPRNR